MNKEEFISELKKLGIIINDTQLDQLSKYYQIMIDYNNHTNLTRITEEKEVYLKHFYDSLTLVKAINLDKQTVLDVGTGAGFPGLVLKIIFPNLKVTLVDSLNKRIIFLKQVIEKLALKQIEVIHARAEEYIVNNREKFDIVTSRAVSNLNTLSELCIPFVKVGGYFIPMKADLKDELKNAEKAIKTLGGVIEESFEFKLFNESDKRTIIKIRKTLKTKEKYPRKFSEIKKNPL